MEIGDAMKLELRVLRRVRSLSPAVLLLVSFSLMGSAPRGTLLAEAPRDAARQIGFPFPMGEVHTVNVLEWDTNALPRIYERSDQLPLSDADIVRLTEAGMPTEMVVKMIEERRCACDASAEGLIAMREAGVDTAIIAAVSTHALRPNRYLNLMLTFDFDGDSRVARERYLYLFIEDGDLVRVFSADLGALLATKRRHDTMVDRSDLLLARTVRRIQLAGRVPLKTYGAKQALVVTSANPALSHPSQLTERELAEAQAYTIDYPRSSVSNICRLHVGYRRDVMLAHRWHFAGSRFECEWD